MTPTEQFSPTLIVDNETSLECREYFLSQRLPVTFVPPQTHRSNPTERAVSTGKITSSLSSLPPTRISLTTFGTDSFPMPKSPLTSCVLGAPIPPSLPGLASTISHTTSPPTLFILLANSALPYLALNTATRGPLTGIASLLLAQ